MKNFVVFLALALLLSGCMQEQGSVDEDVWASSGESAPEAETPPAEPEEEAPADVPPEAESEPEPEEEGAAEDEEELLRWDVGVKEEVDEEHRKLQAVEFDGYVLIVDDITDDYPYPCAALRVGQMGDEYIETLFQDKVCPGDSTYWISPEGGKYRIKVFETAAGYSGFAYWADVAVYKQG